MNFSDEWSSTIALALGRDPTELYTYTVLCSFSQSLNSQLDLESTWDWPRRVY